MNNKLYIQDYCKIKDNKVNLSGEIIFDDNTSEVKDFLKNIYKFLNIKYSKYFKMDDLSKLAFLTSEILLNKVRFDHKNVGIVFSNSASSLDTDRKHQNSINDSDNYFPSPAIFVYTLPNIGIGEISIRHGIKSENAFFIFEKFNADFHQKYESILINNDKCESVLSGWVNVDKGNYEAFVYLVSKNGTVEHSVKNLLELYKN